jgi:hypothetical protein
MTLHDRLAEVTMRYGRDSLVVHALRLATPVLEEAVDRTVDRLRLAGIVATSTVRDSSL